MVDCQSQNGFRGGPGGARSRPAALLRQFGPLQAIGAGSNDHYPGVGMQRTVLLIEHEALGSPVLVDPLSALPARPSTSTTDRPAVFGADSATPPRRYQYNESQRSALGTDSGYQHLAGRSPGQPCPHRGTQFGCRAIAFSTTGSTPPPMASAHLRQLGGRDPAFNLRRESTLILRQRGADHLFASALRIARLLTTGEQAWRPRRTHRDPHVGHDAIGPVIELGAAIGGFISSSWSATAPACLETEHDAQFGGQDLPLEGISACRTPDRTHRNRLGHKAPQIPKALATEAMAHPTRRMKGVAKQQLLCLISRRWP